MSSGLDDLVVLSGTLEMGSPEKQVAVSRQLCAVRWEEQCGHGCCGETAPAVLGEPESSQPPFLLCAELCGGEEAGKEMAGIIPLGTLVSLKQKAV